MKKIDWKYTISFFLGFSIIFFSSFLYEDYLIAGICFTTVGLMIPLGYSLYGV